MKERETYECNGDSDGELSASPTTKQKGCEMVDGDAREVSLEQSQLEDPHSWKVAADPKGSSGSVGQWVKLRDMQPPPPLTPRQQKEQLSSPLAPSPSSAASYSRAPASGLWQQQPVSPCYWEALSPCWAALTLYDLPCASFFPSPFCLICLVVILFQSWG